MYNDIYNKEQFAYMYNTLCKWLRRKVEGESLGNIIKRRYGTDIILYGIGGLGETAFEDIVSSGINIICIADKKYKDFANGYRGVNVVSPEGLKDYEEHPILVLPAFYFREIVDELVKYGIEENRFISLNMLLA